MSPSPSSASPSATLLAAADRIRDLAAHYSDYAHATEFTLPNGQQRFASATEAWLYDSLDRNPVPEAARWIAALSPAVAPMIDQLLRSAAATCEQAAREGWTAEEMRAEADADMRAALDLAGVILGSGVDTHG